MIAPSNFGFNEEAFLTNKFQNRPGSNEGESIQEKALSEFTAFVDQLKKLNVDVHVYSDVADSKTPDSIFPNNWISTHQTGEMIVYPMAVSNRREERRMDIIQDILNHHTYNYYDFTDFENLEPGMYLEGTGSMIFDHPNRAIYAAISPRSHEEVLESIAEALDYSTVSFLSHGKTGELIYHTNVMMCIGKNYVIIGADTIAENQREIVLQSIKESGKEIILLTNDQVYDHFAGNMIQIENSKEETILVMSKTAYDSLNSNQLQRLNDLNDHIVAADIPTIERIGGGSARCMIAELFFPAG